MTEERPLGDRVACLRCGFTFPKQDGHDCPADADSDA
jgi:hypothetical protein